jgi:hypothetical protein
MNDATPTAGEVADVLLLHEPCSCVGALEDATGSGTGSDVCVVDDIASLQDGPKLK